MHPALRRTEGNLLVLRPTEAQRQAEIAAAVAEAIRKAKAEPDQFSDSRVLLSLAARCAIGVIVGYGAVQVLTLLVTGEG